MLGFHLVYTRFCARIKNEKRSYLNPLIGLAMTTSPVIRQSNKEHHLMYAVAHTHGDDSYLLIREKEGRHPIAYYELKGPVIHWVNASGERESIGGEYPLPDDIVALIKRKELYIMEMDSARNVKHAFFINAGMLRP